MRPIPKQQVEQAVALTERAVPAHGGPIHCGDPAAIGVKNLAEPDFGEPVELQEGDVPCFWACGVTSSMAAANAKLPLIITHAPGCMFITDVTVT